MNYKDLQNDPSAEGSSLVVSLYSLPLGLIRPGRIPHDSFVFEHLFCDSA